MFNIFIFLNKYKIGYSIPSYLDLLQSITYLVFNYSSKNSSCSIYIQLDTLYPLSQLASNPPLPCLQLLLYIFLFVNIYTSGYPKPPYLDFFQNITILSSIAPQYILLVQYIPNWILYTPYVDVLRNFTYLVFNYSSINPSFSMRNRKIIYTPYPPLLSNPTLTLYVHTSCDFTFDQR